MGGLGLELSPHLQRRLQSLAVVVVIGGFFVFGPACLAITIYLLTTRFWWFSVGYLLWYTIDQHREVVGGLRHNLLGKWIRSLALWEYMRDYFPITLVKSYDLDPGRNYILGYHPHGVMTVGACAAFTTNALDFKAHFPGISSAFLALKCWFFIPFLREVLLILGMRSASSTNFSNILDNPEKRGRCVVLAIGATEEAVHQSPGRHSILLSSRFGFVKKAILHGADLIPAYGFGEGDLFLRPLAAEASFGRWIQDGFRILIASAAAAVAANKKMPTTTTTKNGRKMFDFALSLMPERKPIRIVVGRPLEVVRNSAPGAEEVLELHRRYCDALKDLFEQHKIAAGLPKDAHLEIL